MKNFTSLSNSFYQFISWVVLSVLINSQTANAQIHLEQRWVTEGLKVPESVYVYKEKRSTTLFVSQIDGQASAVDGKGEIAKMATDGSLTTAEWVIELNAPKGMGVYADKLYVADIDRVVVINIKKGQIEKSYRVAGATFLNDIVIDSKGVIYVSDTRVNKVYKIQNETVETYIDNIDSANGVTLVGKNLIVGAGTKLWLVDKDKKRFPIASGFAQAIDGVVALEKGDFLVSCWAGLIYYVHLDGHIELLLDSQKEKINTADIGFDPATNMLYVPNFSKNSVTAYELKLN